VLLDAAVASARPRRRFEPTDLDLRDEGVAEIDTQVGYTGGTDPRVTAPDVEASLGLGNGVQLELDTTFGWDSQEGSTFRTVENTWATVKLQIADIVDPETKNFWAAGVQVGPKLPTMQYARSWGVEGLAILGRGQGPAHLFVQLGGLLDPYQAVPGTARVRPLAIEGGVDADIDLDDHDRWSFTAEIGASHFFSLSQSETHATAGFACNVLPTLELAVIAIGGYSQGGQLGVLFGATPRFAAF